MNTYTAPIGHFLTVVFLPLVFIPDEEFHSSGVRIKEKEPCKMYHLTNNVSVRSGDEGYWSV